MGTAQSDEWQAPRPANAEPAIQETRQSKVNSASWRGDILEKRRTMMQSWLSHCDQGAAPAGEVVPYEKEASLQGHDALPKNNMQRYAAVPDNKETDEAS